MRSFALFICALEREVLLRFGPVTVAPFGLTLGRQEGAVKSLSPPPSRVNLRWSQISRNLSPPQIERDPPPLGSGSFIGPRQSGSERGSASSAAAWGRYQPKFEGMEPWKRTWFNLSLIKITQQRLWHLVWIRRTPSGLFFYALYWRTVTHTPYEVMPVAIYKFIHANSSGSTEDGGGR